MRASVAVALLATWGSVAEAEDRCGRTAVALPGGDLSWIEVTILERGVVQGEAADRARRMGLDAAEVTRRGEQAWLDLRTKAEGGPVLEVWMSTTCEECLDLRRWSWSLVGRDGVARRPRWTESEVMRQEVEVREVLDAKRELTRSWVRGRLAFSRGDLPADGRVDLHMGRPEAWIEPQSVSWFRGRLTVGEQVSSWFSEPSP